jgi:hypothetical protein
MGIQQQLAGCRRPKTMGNNIPSTTVISDHQLSWEYEDSPWKKPQPPLLVTADFYSDTLPFCENYELRY